MRTEKIISGALQAALISIAIVLIGTLPSAAHDGHGQVHVIADATDVSRDKQTVHLSLALQNYGSQPLRLEAMSVSGARVELTVPQELPALQSRTVPVAIVFDGDVPGIFSAVLDFGAEGQGPVLVMP